MKISFLDLKKVNIEYEEQFKKEFELFLESGYYILGSSVKKFEKEFAKYCGAKHCIGVGNGLDALTLILRGYIELGKLKKGEKVIVAANTYIATIIAIQNAGLIPVLIDADINTFNLDDNLLPEKPESDVKAVMVTHLYGLLAEMNILRNYCSEHNLLLVSDAAQAHGATNSLGEKAGSLADASGFSFYPTKNLGALGDGGAVTTDDPNLADIVIKLRNYGKSSPYVNKYIGVNSRLDEIQAAFLRVKLKKLDLENHKRQEIAKFYLDNINNIKIKLPEVNNINSHVFHQFVIQTNQRTELIKFLNKKGIGNLIHYPTPAYKQEPYKNVLKGNFPITDTICNTVVSIPCNPILKKEELEYIVDSLNSF